VRFHKESHRKIVIVDDLVVIEGSPNITISGLTKNIENVDLKVHPKDVKRYSNSFEELWNNAMIIRSSRDIQVG